MKLLFVPKSRRAPMTLARTGDSLTIDGEAFDFSGLPDGGTLKREAIDCARIAGDVSRDAAGVLTVPLYLPHGPGAPRGHRAANSSRCVTDMLTPSTTTSITR